MNWVPLLVVWRKRVFLLLAAIFVAAVSLYWLPRGGFGAPVRVMFSPVSSQSSLKLLNNWINTAPTKQPASGASTVPQTLQHRGSDLHEHSSTALPLHKVLNDSTAWPPGNAVIYKTNEEFLMPLLRKQGLRVREGLGVRHEVARTGFERWILSTPTLTDFRLAPDELKSKIQIISPPRSSYAVGDKIQFRVDLFDGYGNRRKLGGDEVRARLTSKTGNASMAAEVEDMRNGSYLATAVLQWQGATCVQVYLTYPREFIREAVRLRLTLHSTVWPVMKFSSGSVKEETACLPSSPIPGYASVCNLTDNNGGLPYFCGLPTDRRLSCNHTRWIRPLANFKSLPISQTYRLLVKKIDTPPYQRLIPNNISITTSPGSHRKDPPPCWNLPAAASWQGRAPRGWMDGGRWRPLACSYPELQPLQVQKCLRNTTLYLLGDSNQRVWWYELKKYLRCSKVHLGHAHVHKLCEAEADDTTLKSLFHGRPTNTAPQSENVPLTEALRQLSTLHRRHEHRRVILVFHYFLHFTFYRPAVFLDRVRAARKYIGEFLDAIPEAKVFIRGPHVVLRGYSSQIIDGDLFGPAFIQIWREEFKGLWDRVWFLDFWDMTTATQNKAPHPPEDTVREMVKVFLGHICGDRLKKFKWVKSSGAV